MALDALKSDDETLERLLAGSGATLDTAGVRELIRGVIAAPAALDADAWMCLVAPDPGKDLKKALATLKDGIAAWTTDGLGGGPVDPARLRSLREELKRQDLDGFIVPHSDEHQGEYVALASERLAWLTGFTGSAGLGLILADRAAVFIDGRYTLQAEMEIDSDHFERRHLTEEPPADWIARHLVPGAKLGYDPWLHTPNQAARFQVACKKAGGRLAPVEGNPIDAVWSDQPAPPLSPTVPHDEAFAGASAADKIKQIAKTLTGGKLDAAVLTASDSIAWLLNLRGGDVPYSPLALSFAIVHAEGGVDLFIDGRKLTPATGNPLGGPLDSDVGRHEPDAFGHALDNLGGAKKTVRLNPDGVPVWVFERLEKAGAAIDRGDDPCQLPKARKTDAELDCIRAAHRRDGASLTHFLAWLAAEAPSGRVTEITAADHLESLRRLNDHFQGLSFPTISGAGPNGAIVHYRASEKTDRTLEEGTLYLVDSGAQYLDGTTDVTRTIAIGQPTDEMRRHFTLVLKGHIALATARFPEGTSGSQLDTLARQPLWGAGLDYDHGTGHGVGKYLGVHEGPQRIAKTSNSVPLEPGMVLSDEPGYYKKSAYGIRIENLITVVAAEAPEGAEKPLLKFETLTLAPIDRALVDRQLLSEDEVAWLDAYHAQVADEIGPLVDKTTTTWLKKATAPI